jgi:hypothetical protein
MRADETIGRRGPFMVHARWQAGEASKFVKDPLTLIRIAAPFLQFWNFWFSHITPLSWGKKQAQSMTKPHDTRDILISELNPLSYSLF